ncbi:MAG: Gfo/Idh/MocA family oxidoreductase, partial [Phycisphaerales bacterium]|nr:Gfo/Idh/MocA family oxidoreductase [Phycisphaerales bacterium]
RVNPRIGIIGAGTILPHHVRAYQDIGAPVTAIADVDAKPVAAAASANRIAFHTTDYRDLIGHDDVDIVDVCAPPRFHRDMCVAALEAGKHVICEKPLAISLRDCDEIVAAAERADRRLIVLHQNRATATFLRMRWLIDNDQIGRPLMAQALRYDPPPAALVAQGVWGDWALAGGGVLMTKAIHQLDLMLWLMGPVKRVQAFMRTMAHPIESEDHLVANFWFANGALGSFCASARRGPFIERLDIVGEHGGAGQPWNLMMASGAAQSSLGARLGRLFPLPKRGWRGRLTEIRRALQRRRKQPMRPSPYDNGHTHFLRAALACVRGEAENPCTATEGRAAVELCQAIYQAAISGQTVDLPLRPDAATYQGVSRDAYQRDPRPATVG